MDTNVSKLLKKYKLKLEFAPLHCPGLIVLVKTENLM